MAYVKRPLSPRQRQILEFIRDHTDRLGFPPSIREIGEGVGLSSSSTVHSHLRTLETRGYIERNPHNPRSMRVVDHQPVTDDVRLRDLLRECMGHVNTDLRDRIEQALGIGPAIGSIVEVR